MSQTTDDIPAKGSALARVLQRSRSKGRLEGLDLAGKERVGGSETPDFSAERKQALKQAFQNSYTTDPANVSATRRKNIEQYRLQFTLQLGGGDPSEKIDGLQAIFNSLKAEYAAVLTDQAERERLQARIEGIVPKGAPKPGEIVDGASQEEADPLIKEARRLEGLLATPATIAEMRPVSEGIDSLARAQESVREKVRQRRLAQQTKALLSRRAVYQRELDDLAEAGGDQVNAERATAQGLLGEPLEASRLDQFPEKLQALRSAITTAAGKPGSAGVAKFMKAELAALGPDVELEAALGEYNAAEIKKRKTSKSQADKARELKAAFDKFTERTEILWKNRDQSRDGREQQRSPMLAAVGEPLPSGLADCFRAELERLRSELDAELQSTEDSAFSKAAAKFKTYESLLVAAEKDALHYPRAGELMKTVKARYDVAAPAARQPVQAELKVSWETAEPLGRSVELTRDMEKACRLLEALDKALGEAEADSTQGPAAISRLQGAKVKGVALTLQEGSKIYDAFGAAALGELEAAFGNLDKLATVLAKVGVDRMAKLFAGPKAKEHRENLAALVANGGFNAAAITSFLDHGTDPALAKPDDEEIRAGNLKLIRDLGSEFSGADLPKLRALVQTGFGGDPSKVCTLLKEGCGTAENLKELHDAFGGNLQNLSDLHTTGCNGDTARLAKILSTTCDTDATELKQLFDAFAPGDLPKLNQLHQDLGAKDPEAKLKRMRDERFGGKAVGLKTFYNTIVGHAGTNVATRKKLIGTGGTLENRKMEYLPPNGEITKHSKLSHVLVRHSRAITCLDPPTQGNITTLLPEGFAEKELKRVLDDLESSGRIPSAGAFNGTKFLQRTETLRGLSYTIGYARDGNTVRITQLYPDAGQGLTSLTNAELAVLKSALNISKLK